MSSSKNRLSGISWILAALLLCFISVSAYAEESAPVAVKEEMALCNDLKPLNNINELLYQFFINLDDDCLFVTPIDELEKVWGIKILYKEGRITEEELQALKNGPDFLGKPHSTEKDDFFVQASREAEGINKFTIFVTGAYKLHAPLSPFRDENLPKLIPDPLAKESVRCDNNGPMFSWLSSDRMRMITFHSTNGWVCEISMTRESEPRINW